MRAAAFPWLRLAAAFPPAVATGTIVWSILAGLLAGWVALGLTVWRDRVPSIRDMVRFFLQSWLGRVLALAAWAIAGWHLFCQRP